jgi:hypothetical protein
VTRLVTLVGYLACIVGANAALDRWGMILAFGAMALVLSIAIARMDAEARRREVFRGRSCWAQDPLPTWEEALAHAEVLRAQGVDVRVDEGRKSITIRGTDGELFHDPADGTPAFQRFYPDGTPKVIIRYINGERHDPADGTPASQGFYSDGTPMWISHYTDGWRHDPAGGTPAFQWFYSDGTPMTISHYTNGKLVSEESFGPRS